MKATYNLLKIKSLTASCEGRSPRRTPRLETDPTRTNCTVSQVPRFPVWAGPNERRVRLTPRASLRFIGKVRAAAYAVIGAGLDQDSNNLPVARRRGELQWGPAVLIPIEVQIRVPLPLSR